MDHKIKVFIFIPIAAALLALPVSASDTVLVGIGSGYGNTTENVKQTESAAAPEDNGAASLPGYSAAGTAETETEQEPDDVTVLGSHSTLTVEGTADELAWIQTNLQGQFMPYVIQHAEGNPNVIHFLYLWGHNIKESPAEFSYTQEEQDADIPLLMQWDYRWGFNNYGGGPAALTACAPTCMTMIGYGLTKDPAVNVKDMCAYSISQGYWVSGSGTAWTLVENAFPGYNITSSKISTDESTVRSALQAGHPVLINVGPGRFSAVGHFMVLAAVNDDGTFRLNDPNNLDNSSRSWEWSDLAGEITAAWSYTYNG